MDSGNLYYFDNNATTRVAPEVVEEMLPILTDHWGNPSSGYRFGKKVAGYLDTARERVAALMGAHPDEVVFTSCGTESNNAALHSALMRHPEKRHVLTTAVEHSANIAYANYLLKRGYDVTILPVEPDGSLDLHLLDQSIRPDTAIVSIMWANNETGVLFPIPEIGAICRSKGIPFHTDAVQTPGKVELDLQGLDVDYLSLSAHKLHAPKGVGMLYVNRRSRFAPYLIGGHQEKGRRGGTENVASIVGFGKAAEMAMGRLEEENVRVRALRDRLERTLLRVIPGTSRNGAAEPRLPNTTNIAFSGVEAEGILMGLDQAGVCASSGSACTTGTVEPSHVLMAMGVTPDLARGCLRFSLGVYNTEEEVDYVLEVLPPLVAKLRAMSPSGGREDSPGSSPARAGKPPKNRARVAV